MRITCIQGKRDLYKPIRDILLVIYFALPSKIISIDYIVLKLLLTIGLT